MTDNPYAAPNPAEKPTPLKGGLRSIFIRLLAVGAVVCVGLALLLPAVRHAGPAARRTQCTNYLRQIGLALLTYHDAFGSFPPAYSVDSKGKPLHSWRTLILPYLDQAALYGKIDLSKPWDDPANVEAFQQKMDAYECPETDRPTNATTYLAVVGPNTAFPGKESRSLKQITDGSANTVMVIEVPADQAVPWMSPLDTTEQQFLDVGPKAKVKHTGGMHALFGDGSARFLSVNLAAATRHALVTIDGGETAGEF